MPETPSNPTAQRGGASLSLGAILLYEQVDRFSGVLLLAMTVFSPWAFGTTQPWSIWTMNVAAYGLTGLLAIKLWIRMRLGHQPLRWGQAIERGGGNWRVGSLGVLTVALLGFVAVAALNARADYHPGQLTLDYRDHWSWLPHSYFRAQTWRVWWDYLAWAGVFWSFRDWLLGMTGDEARAARAGTELLGAIPGRLRLWLWVVSLNGAALGVEGIIQRLEGSGRLLFLVQPRVNPAAETQFGPFAYRSNAAQYLNLIWPVTLGLWWWCQQTLRRGTRARRWSHALLGTAIIMAACPIVSTSRAGALVGMMLLAGAVAILITARRADGLLKLGVLGVFGISLAAGAWLGWASLNPRLDDLAEGWRGRELMYQTARVIAAEHPWLGTGPGTFEHIFQIYRQSTDEYWPAQLHNDWLELRLTFGWIGFGMMLAGLSVWVSCAWQKGGIPGSRRFVWLIWLALAGCLVQARWDFPFRVYSIVVLFLLLGSVLTVMGRAGSGR